MIQSIRHFLTREDGAITVDWVVLTAGLVVMAGALGVAVNSGVTSASTKVSTAVSATSVSDAE
ncbi:hypothetical protein [Roseovarius sp.]|uniref:hypothetical protein n=1 Tax=Roseovarius sp. TaxID=1486281 RepID=UPI003D0DC046